MAFGCLVMTIQLVYPLVVLLMIPFYQPLTLAYHYRIINHWLVMTQGAIDYHQPFVSH